MHAHERPNNVPPMRAQVIDTLAQLAGPGGAHARTLLLVFGDHGQTLTGDHGGGTPEELDTALLAVNLAAAHAALSQREGTSDDERATPGTDATALTQSRSGRDVAEHEEHESVNNAGCSSTAAPCPATSSSELTLVPQLDFAATMAALMGLPIPFESIGARCLCHQSSFPRGPLALRLAPDLNGHMQCNTS